MAIILPSLGEMSGSVGGNTFSRNRGGPYVKLRRLPVNPNTARQQTVRNALQSAASSWAALTDSQRSTWTDYGQTHPILNALGQSITLSGISWYVSLTTRLLQAGDAAIATAPAGSDPLPLVTVAIVVTGGAGGTAAITYTPTPLPAGSRLWLWQSLPIGPGKNPNFRQARFAAFSPITAASPQTLDLSHDPTVGQDLILWLAVRDSAGRITAYTRVRETAA